VGFPISLSLFHLLIFAAASTDFARHPFFFGLFRWRPAFDSAPDLLRFRLDIVPLIGRRAWVFDATQRPAPGARASHVALQRVDAMNPRAESCGRSSLRLLFVLRATAPGVKEQTTTVRRNKR